MYDNRVISIPSFTQYADRKDLLRCALAAVQCIIIGPVCLWVCVCVGGWVGMYGWVCYHDNSKLRASILTKLGL